MIVVSVKPASGATQKAVSGALTFSGTHVDVITLSLIAALTLAASVEKLATVVVNGVLTLAGSIGHSVLVALSAALSLNGSLATVFKEFGNKLLGGWSSFPKIKRGLRSAYNKDDE